MFTYVVYGLIEGDSVVGKVLQLGEKRGFEYDDIVNCK
jgi:hypothetical protein